MHVSTCLCASVSRTCNISNVQKIHELYLSFYGHIFDTVDTLTSTCSPEPNCEVPPSQSAQEAEDEAWLTGTHDEMYHQVIAGESPAISFAGGAFAVPF